MAALALTLYAGGVAATGDVFLMVAGSRLGAASFVVLVGLMDYVHRRGAPTLRAALDLGVLTFVVTHTVYLPAAGLELLTPWEPGRRLADRSARSLDEERLRRRWLGRLDRRAVSFAAGLALTAGTASIAFSVGAAVPLYNRGWITRAQLVPYLLGANLATLFDTILVGLALDSPVATSVVFSLTTVVAVFTGLALTFYDRYYRMVGGIVDAVTASRCAFALFLLSLVAAPVLLLFFPMA